MRQLNFNNALTPSDYLAIVNAGRRCDLITLNKLFSDSFDPGNEEWNENETDPLSEPGMTALAAIIMSPDLTSPHFTQDNCDKVINLLFKDTLLSSVLSFALDNFRVGVSESKYFLISLIRQSDCFSSCAGLYWTHCGPSPFHTVPEVFTAVLESDGQVNPVCPLGRTALHYAVFELGCVQLVKLLIQLGVDVNTRDHSQHTPLTYMLKKHVTLDFVKALVEAGADVDAQCLAGCTPLQSASLFSESKTLEYLLKVGANPNHKVASGMTIMQNMMYFDRSERITPKLSALLAAKADVNATNADGRTLLHLAVYGDNAGVVSLLLDPPVPHINVNIRDNDGNTPSDLSAAVKHRNETRLETYLSLLEKAGASKKLRKDALTKEFYESQLALAVRNGDAGLVQHYLDKHVEINGQIPDNSDVEIVTLLIEAVIRRKRDITVNHVKLALKHNRLDWLQAFVKADAELRMQYSCMRLTILGLSSEPDFIKKEMKMLIKAGADIGRRGERNTSLLYETLNEYDVLYKVSHRKKAKLLIKAGANMDVMHISGSTLLSKLCSRKRYLSLKLLIDGGCDVSVCCHNGSTVLHSLCDDVDTSCKICSSKECDCSVNEDDDDDDDEDEHKAPNNKNVGDDGSRLMEYILNAFLQKNQ